MTRFVLILTIMLALPAVAQPDLSKYSEIAKQTGDTIIIGPEKLFERLTNLEAENKALDVISQIHGQKIAELERKVAGMQKEITKLHAIKQTKEKK